MNDIESLKISKHSFRISLETFSLDVLIFEM